eukprot:177197-Amphidinium_carterae.1
MIALQKLSENWHHLAPALDQVDSNLQRRIYMESTLNKAYHPNTACYLSRIDNVTRTLHLQGRRITNDEWRRFEEYGAEKLTPQTTNGEGLGLL